MHAPMKNPKAACSLRAWGLPGPLKEFRSRKSEAPPHPTDAAPKPTMLPLDLAGLRRGFASYSDLFRHPDELDKGLSFHLAHDLSAMHFDRDFTASQLARDLLVQQ